MNIDYEDDESGFWQARAVHAMARSWQPPQLREGDRTLLDFLLDSSRQHMAREDYAQLVAAYGTADTAWPRWSVAQHLWRRLTGRSHVEAELSAQREEAVERAERAELEVFDAVAEATHAAHERDALIAEVAALRHEIERLEQALAAAGASGGAGRNEAS